MTDARLLATELWHLHRRAVIICGALFVGLLAILLVTGLVVRATNADSTHANVVGAPDRMSRPTPGSTPQASTSGAPPGPAPATDVPSWDAILPVAPSTSVAYPAITGAAASDPSDFAAAFVTELFTRDYVASTRAQLESWAQFEDAPLQSRNYPQQDWSKVLVDSLTDLTWDEATDTPVPADGPWLALRSEGARQTVSNVKVGPDSQWEQQIASGYQPPDPITTVRDVSLRVTQRTRIAGRIQTSTYDVSLAVQLGSSAHGGYGVSATNNYVIATVH